MKKVSYYIFNIVDFKYYWGELFIFQVIHLEKGGGDNSNADTILNNVLFKETKAVKNYRVLQ